MHGEDGGAVPDTIGRNEQSTNRRKESFEQSEIRIPQEYHWKQDGDRAWIGRGQGMEKAKEGEGKA